jgi:hypothetical protein
MDWIGQLKKMFSPRPSPKGLTINRAVVDYTGMDPAMKETLENMHGALGAGTASAKTDSTKKVNFGKGK